jgi:hypothetical protein
MAVTFMARRCYYFLGLSFFASVFDRWGAFGSFSGALAPPAAEVGFTLMRVLASIQMNPSSVL